MPCDLALGKSFFMLVLKLCSFLVLLAGSPFEGRPAGTRLLPRVMPGRRLAMAVGCTLMVPPCLFLPAYTAFVAMMQAIISGSRCTFLIPVRICRSCCAYAGFSTRVACCRHCSCWIWRRSSSTSWKYKFIVKQVLSLVQSVAFDCIAAVRNQSISATYVACQDDFLNWSPRFI